MWKSTFLLLTFHPSLCQAVFMPLCACLCPQTHDRKLNSLLNHYDKIAFFVQMLIHRDVCVFSTFLEVLWFLLPLSSSCVPFPFFFFLNPVHFYDIRSILKSFVASEDFLIFSQERRETITFRKRWMDGNNLWQIYGDFPHVKYLTSPNKARLCSHCLC